MNNSRKVTLIISNRLAEEIRQRTNLSMQGEWKARQVFCLALPLACILCLLAEAQVLPHCWGPEKSQCCMEKTKQSQKCSKGAANGELPVLFGVRKVGQLLQQQCCVRQVSARAVWCQPAAARMAVGSLVPALLVSHVLNRTVPAWGYPNSRVPWKHRRSPVFLPAGVCQVKVVQRHSWRWWGREGESCHVFQGYGNLHNKSNQCPTPVTPPLRQWLASRIDVKHLKWEITN